MVRLGLILALASGVNVSLAGYAKTVSQDSTQIGITLRQRDIPNAGHDATIPSGQKPTKTSPNKTTPKKKPSSAIRELASAAKTGKLPQTSDVQTLLVTLVGGLLFFSLILVGAICRQAWLLREE